MTWWVERGGYTLAFEDTLGRLSRLLVFSMYRYTRCFNITATVLYPVKIYCALGSLAFRLLMTLRLWAIMYV